MEYLQSKIPFATQGDTNDSNNIFEIFKYAKPIKCSVFPRSTCM